MKDSEGSGIPVFQLARAVGGEVEGDPERLVFRGAPFDHADETAVTFAETPALLKKLPDCRAGAVVVPESFEPPFDGKTMPARIRHEKPRLAFAKIMAMFHPRKRPFAGISPEASIGRGVSIGSETVVGSAAYIGNRAVLGERVVIYPGAFVGDDVSIGDDTEIMPNVTVMDGCIIGRRVIIHAGTVIGSDGFGFTPEGETHCKIPQTGIVEIGDDAEIGACNTIDRATFGSTRIGCGVKTDNMVHIAHNVSVGDHSLIVAQAGIAGSVRIGSRVTIAGQAGIAGHLVIGDGAVIGPRAGVVRNVDSGRVVSGTPDMDHRQWLRVQRAIPRLPGLAKQVQEMERRLRSLEEAAGKTGDSELDR